MNRRQQSIDKLQNLDVIYTIPLSIQYVNSSTKIRIECSQCRVEIAVLPLNLVRRGSVSCNTCRYILSSNSLRKYAAPDWFVNRWRAIETRCGNPLAKSYKNYGGRGIKLNFDSADEMWDHLKTLDGCCHSLTVDRIDNDGNYEIGNLRWASRVVQNNNTRFKCIGVRRVNGSPHFQARITKDSKEIYLGTFDTYALARTAVIEANREKINELQIR